jgi:TatD DNase family protein
MTRAGAGTGATARARARVAPPPEPLPAEAFDSHCHLDMIERPPGQIVADAAAAGITRMITVGCDLPSSRWAAACAAEHEPVYAAVAIHPNETAAAA